MEVCQVPRQVSRHHWVLFGLQSGELQPSTKTLWAVLDHRLDLVNDQHVHSCRKADRGLNAPATGAESDFWCSTSNIHKEQHMRMDQD